MFPIIIGNRSAEAEDLMAYEAGYREQVTEALAWDLAVFFHDYSDVNAFVPQWPAPGKLIQEL